MAASGSLSLEDKKYGPSGGLSAIPSAQVQSKEAQSLTASSSDGLPSRQFKQAPAPGAHFARLPNAILKDVLTPMLSMDAKAKSNASCQFFNSKLEGELTSQATQKFLLHVARGEQDQAEVMLKDNPELLLRKGDVTDYSGRAFHNITAFQYALWAYDRHMWNMLLKYFPRSDGTDEALKQLNELEAAGVSYQLNELEAAGVSYQLNDSKTQWIRESHYDWRLLTEFENYYRATEALMEINKRIVIAQQQAPAHIANEHCRPDRPFLSRDWEVAQFDDDHLPRSFEVKAKSLSDHWFPLDSKSVFSWNKHVPIARRDPDKAQLDYPSSIDLIVLRSLRSRRKSEYKHLKHDLTIRPIKEKFFKELQKIIQNVSYWSDKTHYQFCRGGTKHNEHRIPDYVSQMLKSKQLNFDSMTDKAEQAIKPGSCAKFFGQTERRSAGRDPATHEFYKMLTQIKRIASDIRETEPEKKIQVAIDEWKKDYMSASTPASPLRPA
jgi:hypothetical protein